MTIAPATQNNFSAALALLKKNHLPTEDITDITHLFVVAENDDVLGTIALEYKGGDGLLRSLCVAHGDRSKGMGGQLVHFIEAYAKERGVRHLWLLTTTAAQYFQQKGYTAIEREETPEVIRNTSEFASVCPASAVVMKKELA
ncbi:MAG: GNAT family N-acetyltransferase [Flavisolibacter sp.]|nr:GNAT family N-acetyltransferase [Flavisolibacter sp.]